MKVTVLSNLEEMLRQMNNTFGAKTLSEQHRSSLDNYILQIDYDKELSFDTSSIVTESATLAMLGTGQLGMMILGNS